MSAHVSENNNANEIIDASVVITNSNMRGTDIFIEDPIDQVDTFGVDEETKNMNIVQFYRHLLIKYSNNRIQIHEFLRTMGRPEFGCCGFLQTAFLEKSYKSMSTSEKNEYCSLLSKLSSEWAKSGIISIAHSANEFETQQSLRESYAQSVVTLKYFDLNGARFWRNCWAKETRGTVLFINPESLDVKILSFKLPRGAEVSTGMTIKKGIETQDVKHNKTSILDDEQKDTCAKLCKNMPIRLHLTSKADGSLFVINTYTGSALSIMKPIVEYFGSEYAKIWMNQSLTLSNDTRLIIPASQGTLMETGYIGAYTVTSLLVGTGIVSRNELEDDLSYVDAWRRYGSAFIGKFLNFRFFDTVSETHTYCFEAICKNRSGLFNDRQHIEMACSYNRDRLLFLGMSLADKRFYVPHSVLGEISPIPFEEPLWWEVKHASQVDKMIDAMNDLILNKINKRKFFQEFPPSNLELDITNVHVQEDVIIDYEGWVAMKYATFNHMDDDYTKVTKCIEIPLMIYSKIKTEPYYRAHIFHIENIQYLVELSKTSGTIFPLALKIKDICKSGVLTERFINTRKKILALLDFSDKNNIVLSKLRAINSDRMNNNTKGMKDPLKGFEMRPFEIQCKLALNFKGFDFGELLVPIYLEEFPEIDANTTELKNMLFGLTMNLKPWSESYIDSVKDLNLRSPKIQCLIKACIGESVI